MSQKKTQKPSGSKKHSGCGPKVPREKERERERERERESRQDVCVFVCDLSRVCFVEQETTAAVAKSKSELRGGSLTRFSL